MTRHALVALSLLALVSGCGGGGSSSSSSSSSGASGGGTSGGEGASSSGGAGSASSDEEDSAGFQLSDSTDAASAHGDHPSEIQSSATEAALRFFVVDPDAGALQGIVIKLEGADGRIYYTDETDAQGYAEVLVNPGQRYDLEYLSLGRTTTAAHVDVPAGPNQDIRLTLRYRRHRRPRTELSAAPAETTPAATPEPEHLVLDGILFESGSATLDPESNPRLDRVVEYMTHRTSARIRIAGHTYNVGNPQRNQQLSEQRAQAVRAYIVAHGIEGSRVEAVGYGDTQPVASNDTEEGRAQNRRIEAIEL